MPTSADHSAGILLYRRRETLEVFIGHMGGPIWARRDAAAWSIPKGLIEPGEDEFETARREFAEEIGQPAPRAEYVRLGDFRYVSGKVVTVFAAEGDLHFDEHAFASNPVTVEWPRGSGREITFPEIDRAEWCSAEVARTRLVKGQVPALGALEATLR
ncbi:NUDIX domain-containing protein [Conyzicola nivalis]|uniref:DNA mismatch repair protein MutT n=1 Tax=Conyzicola nivalis TaxID=1477021 RepID=A0A916SKB9_9MICO|nr:NUDIX domain-containing protein [Conyzicola nivalis]GGB00579.1 DNA mismatch repair protein MutT [Conyzicola nivalis]